MTCDQVSSEKTAG